MALVQDELSTGARKTWAAPKLDTIEMRNTAQLGKSLSAPECTGVIIGVDDDTHPLCNVLS